MRRMTAPGSVPNTSGQDTGKEVVDLVEVDKEMLERSKEREKRRARRSVGSENSGGESKQLSKGNQSKFSGEEQKQFPGEEEKQFSGGEPGQFSGGEEKQFSGGKLIQFSGDDLRQFSGGEERQFSGAEPRQFAGGDLRQFSGEEARAAPLHTLALLVTLADLPLSDKCLASLLCRIADHPLLGTAVPLALEDGEGGRNCGGRKCGMFLF